MQEEHYIYLNDILVGIISILFYNGGHNIYSAPGIVNIIDVQVIMCNNVVYIDIY